MPDIAGAAPVAAIPSPPRRLAPAWAASGSAVASAWVSLALFLGLAFAMRAFLLGNPVFHVDEEFYLYAAQRWSEGALPYVGVWDRKPIGLFALYRLFLLAPGDGVLAYQLAGIACTALTALVIERLAREIAPPHAARIAGIAYVLYMPVFNCALGQGPVFYNLPVALAALVLVEAWKQPCTSDLTLRGMQAMALVGVAIQIKTCVVFEGVAFGLMLLARGQRAGWTVARLAGAGTLWVGAALAPLLVALAGYAAAGHADAFIHANFVSVFLRGSEGAVVWWRLTKETAALTPFWLAIFLAPRKLAMPAAQPAAHGVLRAWGLAAVAGFLVFGTWYDHYVAPMLVPLAVLAAPALGRARPGERWYTRLLLGFGTVAALAVMIYQVNEHGTAAQVDHMTGQVRAELRDGCYFQFDGEPALYRTVNACVPTRFAFPGHLNTYTEAPAIGVDANAEVARIMLTHPDVVQIAEWSDIYLPNHQTRAIVRDFLARDYVLYGRATLGAKTFGLYRLRR